MTEGRLNSFLLMIVPAIVAGVMRLWFATCRVTVHDNASLFKPGESGRQGIASFWHYSIIFLFYFMRKYQATAMVSASRDGEYIARLAGHFGFSTVRGSRNRRGAEALKQIFRRIKSGSNGAIVADGSQGPARVAQPGVILLASRTGVEIVPMGWAASAYFTFPSWDKTAIPYPFSRVDVYYGEPLSVPPGIDNAEVARYCSILQERLNEMYAKAWAQYGLSEH